MHITSNFIFSIRRGVGYFSFDNARWQQFQLQLCQSTSSINCYITIQRFLRSASDNLHGLLQQRRQLLMHLECSVAEVCKCCMPSAQTPLTCLECPLHGEDDKDYTPHVILDISKKEYLMCHEKCWPLQFQKNFTFCCSKVAASYITQATLINSLPLHICVLYVHIMYVALSKFHTFSN